MATAAKLPLGPTDPRVRGWEWAVRRLEADVALRRLSPIWRTPDAPEFADDPPASGVWVRLTPELLPEESAGLLGHGLRTLAAPLRIHVETRVPGFLWWNAAGVGAALFRALSPPASADHRAFRRLHFSAGVAAIDFGKPPDPTGPDEIGRGHVTLTCYVAR